METITKTLPIDLKDGLYLDMQAASAMGDELTGIYRFAEPYPHIVIDNFLPDELIEQILANFPQEDTGGEKHYEKGYGGLHKRQISPNNCNGYIRNVFQFFNSAPMLQFLENLTGIKGLIADPYFVGGGFHETSRGGLLGVHADFRINRQLHVERRLNAIIYLNKDWQDEYGGHLEIWDQQMQHCVKQVAPIFNRCVVFNTDEDSNHGHPNPLTTPDGITRKSIALYYYTASQRIYEDMDSFKTMYKARPEDGEEIRTQVKKLASRNKKRPIKNFVKRIKQKIRTLVGAEDR